MYILFLLMLCLLTVSSHCPFRYFRHVPTPEPFKVLGFWEVSRFYPSIDSAPRLHTQVPNYIVNRHVDMVVRVFFRMGFRHLRHHLFL